MRTTLDTNIRLKNFKSNLVSKQSEIGALSAKFSSLWEQQETFGILSARCHLVSRRSGIRALSAKFLAETFWYSFNKMPPCVKTIRNRGTIHEVFQYMGVAETFWYSFSVMPPCVKTIKNRGTIRKIFSENLLVFFLQDATLCQDDKESGHYPQSFQRKPFGILSARCHLVSRQLESGHYFGVFRSSRNSQ
ncbi:hypothetical protein V6N12_050123 [Hibiscus sabdariffa]|uniref:Uncharacterized protein n=1 Tax=Hibiscus sabdariffa TaxID=183260 RepID=A0ABR2GBI5_9ROSI